jgi:hypothetical protein
MTIEFSLFFRGLRYPRAKIEPAESVDGLPVFLVSSTDGGKPWTAEKPQAFWRDLVELDLANGAQVLEFVKRRGLLCSEPLGAPQQELTREWHHVQAGLRDLERAWGPPDAEGVSQVRDSAKAREIFEAHSRDLSAQRYGWDRVKSVPGPDGIKPVSTTLASYMIGSALLGLISVAGGPMRRCDFCGSWFHRLRSDARFCCSSHRTQYFLKQKQAAA